MGLINSERNKSIKMQLKDNEFYTLHSTSNG